MADLSDPVATGFRVRTLREAAGFWVPLASGISMNRLGAAFLGLAVLCPAILTLATVSDQSLRNMTALSAGTIAFTLMALNLFLAARPAGLEQALGGLDRVYRLHRVIGIAVLVLVLVHTQYKFQQLSGVLPPGTLGEIAVQIAKPAFYLLVALLLLSAIKRLPGLRLELPWGLWRFSHRLMGPIFAVLAVHQLLVLAPFTPASPIGQWLVLMSMTGLGAWLWTLFGPSLRRAAYVVDDVIRHPGATLVTASPAGRGIRAAPGQFAFVSARRSGLSEPHPFTLSRVGADRSVEFSIQPVGDFTRQLRKTLQPGDRLRLEGGYGRFTQRKAGARQVWLAGGIGITPFLAMAEGLAAAPAPADTPGPQVVLIHSARNREAAVGAERLAALARDLPGFDYHLHDSSTEGRLSAESLLARLPFAMTEAELWVCGPVALRRAMLEQLKAAGQSPARVHHEEFEFR